MDIRESVLSAAIAVVLGAGAVSAVVVHGDHESTNVEGTFATTATTTLKPYVADDAKFSAVFPVTPSRQELPIEQPGLSLKGVYYQSASRQNTTYVGRAAEDAVIAAPQGTLRFRAVYIDNRLYGLLGVTPSADSPHPAYDRLLATFTPT
jgi:hypothetical protein